MHTYVQYICIYINLCAMLIVPNQYFPLTHFANCSAHKIKANDLDCQFKLNQTLQLFRQPHTYLWTYAGAYIHLHTTVDVYVCKEI